MKEEKKLTEAIKMLEDSKLESHSFHVKEAMRLLMECHRANTKEVKIGKLDLYDWTEQNDNPRLAMNYVWHNPVTQEAIASNSQVLIVCKSLYDSTLEPNEKCTIGRGDNCPKCATIDKKGRTLEQGVFPQYEAVFPKENLVDCPIITREQAEEAYKYGREYLKLHPEKRRGGPNVFVKLFDGFVVRLNNLGKALELPGWEFKISSPNNVNRGPIVFNNGDIRAVIMGIVPSAIDNMDKVSEFVYVTR